MNLRQISNSFRSRFEANGFCTFSKTRKIVEFWNSPLTRKIAKWHTINFESLRFSLSKKQFFSSKVFFFVQKKPTSHFLSSLNSPKKQFRFHLSIIIILDIRNQLMTSVNFHRPCKLHSFSAQFPNRSLSNISYNYCNFRRHMAISNEFYLITQLPKETTVSRSIIQCRQI